MKIIKAPRGIRDVLYPESGRWEKISGIVSSVLEGYGFRKIFLPVIESAELFSRCIGEETDIVSKEMYVFKDRKGRSLALRPEGTAGAVRAMIEHDMLRGRVREKVFYIGPMFRYERPQEGRYRQFYQAGCEVFGPESHLADAEIAAAVLEIVKRCGVTNSRLRINSVGCPGCRAAYRDEVAGFLSDRQDILCPDCRRRAGTNTLRVLDCKNGTCRQIYTELPVLKDYLCAGCADFYSSYRSLLEELDIPFEEDTGLVRGLDYYTGPVFELDAGTGVIAAGGRYDRLVEQLGGPPTPACGWAFGIERLAAASAVKEKPVPSVYIALLPGGDTRFCREISRVLREAGISVEEDYEDISPGKKLKTADRKGASRAVLIGEEESSQRFLSIKDLETGRQESIPEKELRENPGLVLK